VHYSATAVTHDNIAAAPEDATVKVYWRRSATARRGMIVASSEVQSGYSGDGPYRSYVWPAARCTPPKFPSAA